MSDENIARHDSRVNSGGETSYESKPWWAGLSAEAIEELERLADLYPPPREPDEDLDDVPSALLRRVEVRDVVTHDSARRIDDAPDGVAGSITRSSDPAIEFLFSLQPDGFRLTAIMAGLAPVACDFDARTNGKADYGAQDWIRDLEKRGWDIYFSPNPVMPRAGLPKATKIEVAEARWLWADLDPPKTIAADELPAWRQETLARLRAELPGGLPAPTMVTDSGRGYWMFWRLAEPVPLAGDEAAITQVESVGAGIEGALREAGLGADACHNVDRIARLPGTRNTKTGALASVIVNHPERTHGLADFPRVELEPERLASPPSGSGTGLPGWKNAQVPEGFVFRPAENTPPWLQDRIKNPPYADHGGDRSAAVWNVLNACIRCGIHPDEILKLALEPRYEISSHFLKLEDGKPRKGATAFARRQVEKALKGRCPTGPSRRPVPLALSWSAASRSTSLR